MAKSIEQRLDRQASPQEGEATSTQESRKRYNRAFNIVRNHKLVAGLAAAVVAGAGWAAADWPVPQIRIVTMEDCTLRTDDGETLEIAESVQGANSEAKTCTFNGHTYEIMSPESK